MIKQDLEKVANLALTLNALLEDNPNLSGYSANANGKASLEFLLDQLIEIGYYAEMEARNM